MPTYKLNEASLQQWYVRYLESKGLLYCASAGGLRTSMKQAVKMKRTGYKRGFPDIFIYEPRGGWHGMAVEIKYKGRPTKEQLGWLVDLCARKYYATYIPYNSSFRDCQEWLVKETEKYLDGKIVK